MSTTDGFAPDNLLIVANARLIGAMFDENEARKILRCAGGPIASRTTGIVIAVSQPSSYVTSATFVCPEKCSSGSGQILIHGQDFLGNAPPSSFECPGCGANLEEFLSERRVGSLVHVSLLPRNGGPAVVAILRGPQMVTNPILTLGAKLELLGYLDMKFSPRLNYALEHLETTTVCPAKQAPGTYVPNDPGLLMNSPWEFARSVAESIGGDSLPSNTFVSLRYILLLSLIASESEIIAGSHTTSNTTTTSGDVDLKSDPLSILVIGDNSAALALIRQAATLASHTVVHASSTDTLSGTAAVRSAAPSGGYMIDAGSALLTHSSGVLQIPWLSLCKPQQLDQLESVLGSQEVHIKVATGLTVDQRTSLGFERTNTFPARTTVWATSGVQQDVGHPIHVKRRDVRQLAKSVGISDRLLGFFSIIIDVSPDDDADIVIANHMLQRAVDKDRAVKAPMSAKDLQDIIQAAQQRKVKFCATATMLIQNFYLVSRRIRATQRRSIEIDKRSLRTLMQLAHGHAKLSLRTTVIDADAIIAILIFEESMAVRHGYSVLGMVPAANYNNCNLERYGGNGPDEQLESFSKHVRRFLHDAHPSAQTDSDL